jgi:hypothetical protein
MSAGTDDGANCVARRGAASTISADVGGGMQSCVSADIGGGLCRSFRRRRSVGSSDCAAVRRAVAPAWRDEINARLRPDPLWSLPRAERIRGAHPSRSTAGGVNGAADISIARIAPFTTVIGRPAVRSAFDRTADYPARTRAALAGKARIGKETDARHRSENKKVIFQGGLREPDLGATISALRRSPCGRSPSPP